MTNFTSAEVMLLARNPTADCLLRPPNGKIGVT
jgi:hypothetical protein